jgi:CheY-like chemotaxis protein
MQPVDITILVVEDDPGVRRMAVGALENLGYKVQQACDGNAALAVLRGPDKIDLVFTDMMMPNGPSGQELIRTARQLRPGIKALLASGYSDTLFRMRESANRDIRLLSKPYRHEALAAAVSSALDCGA